MPTPAKSYDAMTAEEQAALEIDPVTGKAIVARGEKAGVIWLAFSDGTTAVRDADGNPATWPD